MPLLNEEVKRGNIDVACEAIAFYMHGDVDKASVVKNQLNQLWAKHSSKALFQSGLQLLTERDDEITKEQFATWAACQMSDKKLPKTVRRIAQSTGFQPSPNTGDQCTWAFKECFRVAAAGYFRLDVVDGAPTNWRIVVLKNAQVPAGEGLPYLRHNGPIETGLASWYRYDDCLVIAFNNACGGMYLTRQQMAEIDDRFAKGHISLKAIAGVVDQHTPFNLQLQRSLQRSFEVFTVAQGIYIVALVLTRSDGAVFTHAIAVDRNRNVINFGLNDDGDDQITIHPEGFEAENESSAKEGLLSYFKDLKDIAVADVWRVRVKTKRLAEVPHAALLPPPVKAVAPDAQGINEYKRKQREEGQATGKYDLVGDSKVEEIDLTDSPPAKKMKATKALEDMTIDELQAEYKAKLNVIQVRGPSARNKAWLIDKIQGGLTVRAKRALGNKQGASSKRPRN